VGEIVSSHEKARGHSGVRRNPQRGKEVSRIGNCGICFSERKMPMGVDLCSTSKVRMRWMAHATMEGV